MKKTLLIATSILLSSLSVSAGPIDKNLASSTAREFLASKGKMMLSSNSAYKAPRKKANSAAVVEEPGYYVFNAENGNGYVIVSGDDRTEPILGYVEEGSFDPNDIPENLRNWLQFYVDQIQRLDSVGYQPAAGVNKVRGRRINPTYRSIPEILKTRWNQGYPYNILCPKYYRGDGTRDYPASGCTATALSQVHYFYKYPEKTKAVIPAHSMTYTLDDGTKKTTNAPAVKRGTVLKWDDMREVYDGTQTGAQDTAVAELLLYWGTAVNMGWGPSSGAACGDNAAQAFIKYFGFDDGAFSANRSDYTKDDWFKMVYHELDEGYPVTYVGFSSGGGHAFVVDGFDGDNLFHVNWGWGGGSNGWFLLSVLNPGDNSGIGASSSSDGYSMGQSGIFNLRLPDNVKADPRKALTIQDLNINNTNASLSAKFINWTGSNNSFSTCVVAYVEEEDTYQPVSDIQSISSMGANTVQNKTFYMNKKLSAGTYKLSIASKMASGKAWHPMHDCKRTYIEAVVNATGTPTMRLVEPVFDLKVDTVVYPGTRIVNTQQEVRVTFHNDGDEFFGEYHLFASKTDQKVYMDNRSAVCVKKGEDVTISFYFTPEETGTYNLWLCKSSNGSGELFHTTVDIITEAEAEKPNLTVTAVNLSNLVNGSIYGNKIVGKATLKNNQKKDFKGRIKVEIWTQELSGGYGYHNKSNVYEVEIPASKSAVVPFEFNDTKTNIKNLVAFSYADLGGRPDKGGVWDHGFTAYPGVMTWKEDGTYMVAAPKTSVIINSAAAGVYMNQTEAVSRISPSKNNPNVMYVIRNCKKTPSGLDGYNLVVDGHADKINITDGYSYYVPQAFIADAATYTFTFPETVSGNTWQTFTMPFAVDSIFVDDEMIELNDEAGKFWIYEFSATDDTNMPVFTPATKLRANTPYIIAGDARMSGKTIRFTGTGQNFPQSGTDKMIVSSDSYVFHATTVDTKLSGVYVLNEEGTAFVYTEEAVTVKGLKTYFTTKLSAEERIESIPLCNVPVSTDIIATRYQSKTNGKIYSITGQQLPTEKTENLKPGIYVRNGKKILVK